MRRAERAEKTEKAGRIRGGDLVRRHLSIFSALSALSALSAVPAALTAQTRVSGRVVGADSVGPVPNLRVILHQVGRSRQGPIDSTRSDRQGRFRFAFRADTSAFYLASARYAGIEYFSPPLPTGPARGDPGIRIVVFDTSSTTPVVLQARHFVLTRPTEAGSRGVLDLLVLGNSGRLTRVASDTVRGSWSTLLPRRSVGLEVVESDISAESVRRSGDSLVVSAALAPGDKQLTLQYEIPPGAGVVEVPLGADAPAVNVLVEEPGVRVLAPGLTLADSQTIQGRTFERWTGNAQPGGVLRLVLPGGFRPPSWLLAALVGGLALALLAAGGYALARRPTTVRRTSVDALVGEIAALDARYAGRREETGEEEWSVYLAERARLKAQLETTLATERVSR